jgi:hypothetical protein
MRIVRTSGLLVSDRLLGCAAHPGVLYAFGREGTMPAACEADHQR